MTQSQLMGGEQLATVQLTYKVNECSQETRKFATTRRVKRTCEPLAMNIRMAPATNNQLASHKAKYYTAGAHNGSVLGPILPVYQRPTRLSTSVIKS